MRTVSNEYLIFTGPITLRRSPNANYEVAVNRHCLDLANGPSNHAHIYIIKAGYIYYKIC